MNSYKSDEILLSAIVPITLMAGRLNLLKRWTAIAENKPIEILLIHDIADEETGRELKEILAATDNKKIILIEGEFGSPGLARNIGIDKATGNWITFWDSDDKPELETVLEILQKNYHIGELDLIIGQFNVFVMDNGRISPNVSRTRNLIDISLNPGLWRMIFRRDAIKNAYFQSFRMAEDQNFLSTINLPTLNYKILDNIFYTYYTGTSSQLTAQQSAINEIFQAAKFTLGRIANSNKANQKFNCILFTRQIITGLKKGSWIIKLNCLGLFLCSFFLSGSVVSRSIVGSVFTIIINQKNRKLT